MMDLKLASLLWNRGDDAYSAKFSAFWCTHQCSQRAQPTYYAHFEDDTCPDKSLLSSGALNKAILRVSDLHHDHYFALNWNFFVEQACFQNKKIICKV